MNHDNLNSPTDGNAKTYRPITLTGSLSGPDSPTSVMIGQSQRPGGCGCGGSDMPDRSWTPTQTTKTPMPPYRPQKSNIPFYQHPAPPVSTNGNASMYRTK